MVVDKQQIVGTVQHTSARASFVLSVVLLGLSLAFVTPLTGQGAGLQHTANESVIVVPALILIDLPASSEMDARVALERYFGPEAMQRVVNVATDEDGTPDVSLDAQAGDVVLALGAGACERAVGVASVASVVCALLYRQTFAALECRTPCQGVHAIVMDQPLSRQVKLSQSLFPSLSRFSVLEQQSRTGSSSIDIDSIETFVFNPDEPIGVQVSDALMRVDALIAVADTTIYNSDTLRTILLTAYGMDKSVIGYGAAFVKAGSLLSAFSTPEHIVRQLSEEMVELSGNPRAPVSQSAPRYFSVEVNMAVARSLGLGSSDTVAPGQTLSDEDLRR